ncbi:MAG: hypothetical protein IT168_08255 [Bryobacterales bacterium]|nr:hypothetical protein [Bryobacterales bacterium]
MVNTLEVIAQAAALMSKNGGVLGMEMAVILLTCGACREHCPGIVACATGRLAPQPQT